MKQGNSKETKDVDSYSLDDTDIHNKHISREFINNVMIENVAGYVYLGQHYSLKEKNQDKFIQRRIMAGWAA